MEACSKVLETSKLRKQEAQSLHLKTCEYQGFPVDRAVYQSANRSLKIWQDENRGLSPELGYILNIMKDCLHVKAPHLRPQ